MGQYKVELRRRGEKRVNEKRDIGLVYKYTRSSFPFLSQVGILLFTFEKQRYRYT